MGARFNSGKGRTFLTLGFTHLQICQQHADLGIIKMIMVMMRIIKMIKEMRIIKMKDDGFC